MKQKRPPTGVRLEPAELRRAISAAKNRGYPRKSQGRGDGVADLFRDGLAVILSGGDDTLPLSPDEQKLIQRRREIRIRNPLLDELLTAFGGLARDDEISTRMLHDFGKLLARFTGQSLEVSRRARGSRSLRQ